MTQQGFNLYAWTEHMKHALHRMALLGCQKILWSDGRARVLPVEGAGLKEAGGFLSRVGKDNLSCAVSLRELEQIGLALPRRDWTTAACCGGGDPPGSKAAE